MQVVTVHVPYMSLSISNAPVSQNNLTTHTGQFEDFVPLDISNFGFP